MSYKTLILIDNSNTLTTANMETIRATLKYFVTNIDKDNKVAIAVTGETAQYLTEYDDSLNTQLKTIDGLEFMDVNAPGGDVLMEVLLEWEKSDFAYRDIVYISGRNIALMNDYTEEELLFEVNGNDYPIYVIALSQNENDGVVKGLNVFSRLSGGVCVNTDELSSDAQVEKQISDKLYSAMQAFRSAEQKRFEENANDVESGNEQAAENKPDGSENADDSNLNDLDVLSDEFQSETNYAANENFDESNVVYEMSDEYSSNHISKKNELPIIIIPVVIIAFFLAIYIKKRMMKDSEFIGRNENGVADKTSKTIAKDELFGGINSLNFSEKGFSDTSTSKLISHDGEETDTGTRLLYQARDGIEITLEDRADPTKFYRACVRDSVVIGRNGKVCDIAINYDDSVSSRHCELYARDNVLYCRDLDSSNGTMINQHKVYQEIAIESGDILRIGRLTFFIQIVGDI